MGSSRHVPWSAVMLIVVGVAISVAFFWWSEPSRKSVGRQPDLPFERLTNTYFTPEPEDIFEVPEVRMVDMPPVPNDAAVWGATGRDDRGNIWIGVSMNEGDQPSARLVEYDPRTDLAIERGDVLSELGRLNLRQPGDAQAKIHSRFVQAGDGNLYFASMNDTHEEGGPRAPPFGSHLWRLRLPERTWEHLLAAPEGLIAVAGAGNYIYALGYPNHRLVQFHVPTGAVRWTTVGSHSGHVSRNLIADVRGHVYVPRVSLGAETTLVEFDTDLKEISATPLLHYMSRSPEAAHGIIAFQHLPDRSIYFATDMGRLYRIDADLGAGPALVRDAGWFHPDGTAYTPCLFTRSGTSTLVGIVGRKANPPRMDWTTYDIRARMPVFAKRLSLPTRNGQPLHEVAIYGSQTRDSSGDFYAAGFHRANGRVKPLVLRIQGRSLESKPAPNRSSSP